MVEPFDGKVPRWLKVLSYLDKLSQNERCQWPRTARGIAVALGISQTATYIQLNKLRAAEYLRTETQRIVGKDPYLHIGRYSRTHHSCYYITDAGVAKLNEFRKL